MHHLQEKGARGMDAAMLIKKLVEFECEVGKQIPPGAHTMLLEAQFCAIQLHRERMDILKENVKLRSALMTALALMPPQEQRALGTPQEACA